MSIESGYALGYSPEEARRLEIQAALSDDILEDGLRRGGLRPGMKVLDIGSGVGDVAFRAAQCVGPDGFVTGVERWGPSLETARARAGQRGLANVHFLQSELESFDPPETYDALIGRFILQYLPFRVELLARLKQRLKPGGVVIFQEVDNSGAAQHPPSELFQRVNALIAAAFAATGSVHDMGALLAKTFLGAGLPRPQMIAMSRVESGPDTPLYEFYADVLRSVMPVLKKIAPEAADAIGLNSLTQRLREDAVANERTVYTARIVTAWTRVN